MEKPLRLHTNQKVEIIDSQSKYFGRIGTLVELKREPVEMRLENHWLVKLEGIEITEVFAPNQFKVID